MIQTANVPKPTTDVESPALETLTDEQIIQRITHGDSAALELLYDRYAPAVMGLAMKMLNRDRAAAEEIVQESFWRVWKKASSYKAANGQPASWLFGIARNLCIDLWRRRKARPQPIFDDEQETHLHSQPDPGANVAETVWTSIKHKHVKIAVQVLPTEQRRVIEMAYFWGMTRQEIAYSLNLPLGTVHTRARLGLKKLREALRRQGIGDE